MLIFNNQDFGEYVIVNGVRRAIIPPQTNITNKIPGLAGEHYARKELGMGLIEVDITLVESDPVLFQQKIRSLAAVLYAEKPKKLTLIDEPDKYNLVILDGDLPLDKRRRIGQTTLVFLCPDPLTYSERKIQVALEGAVINTGTYQATGTIKINIDEGAKHLKVTLQNTGEYLYLEDDFKANDEVVISLEDESIRKNDNLIMDKLHFESDFFALPVGEFEITLSSGSGTLEFRERWL